MLEWVVDGFYDSGVTHDSRRVDIVRLENLLDVE